MDTDKHGLNRAQISTHIQGNDKNIKQQINLSNVFASTNHNTYKRKPNNGNLQMPWLAEIPCSAAVGLRW